MNSQPPSNTWAVKSLGSNLSEVFFYSFPSHPVPMVCPCLLHKHLFHLQTLYFKRLVKLTSSSLLLCYSQKFLTCIKTAEPSCFLMTITSVSSPTTQSTVYSERGCRYYSCSFAGSLNTLLSCTGTTVKPTLGLTHARTQAGGQGCRSAHLRATTMLKPWPQTSGRTPRLYGEPGHFS